MAKACTHLDQIKTTTAKTPDGCEECLASGGKWVQLRLCLACGHVGCCDSSPGKHATGHWKATHHAVMREYPGAAWGWCYADEATLNAQTVAAQR